MTQSLVRYDTQSAREEHNPSRMVLLVLGVILLVFLVALGSGRSIAHVGGIGDLSRAQLVLGSLFVLVVGAVVPPGIVFVIWRAARYLRHESELPPGKVKTSEKKLVVFLIVWAAIVAAAFAIAVFARNKGSTPFTAPASTHDAPRRPPSPPRKDLPIESLAPWVFGAVGILLVVLIVVLVLRRRADRYHETVVHELLGLQRDELREVVESSLEDIERESDPRRAVIRAYAGMEGTLARHKLGRRPAEAPGEYLARAFSSLKLSRRPAERLTRLFEQARFSEHVIEPEMKREAIAALGELRAELESGS